MSASIRKRFIKRGEVAKVSSDIKELQEAEIDANINKTEVRVMLTDLDRRVRLLESEVENIKRV